MNIDSKIAEWADAGKCAAEAIAVTFARHADARKGWAA